MAPTKQKLLDAAQHLMLVKGYPATTLDEICLEAGVTKGSFFHYFEDKEAVGAAVLDYFVGERVRALGEATFHQHPDPLARVFGYLDFVTKRSRNSGSMSSCLLGNFAQDIAGTHPRLRALCAQHFDRWAAMLKRELDAAKRAHAPKANIDTGSLADHCIAVLEGALILSKAKDNEKLIIKQLNHLKTYLRSLFKIDRA